jgi:hypothetical protein
MGYYCKTFLLTQLKLQTFVRSIPKQEEVNLNLNPRFTSALMLKYPGPMWQEKRSLVSGVEWSGVEVSLIRRKPSTKSSHTFYATGRLGRRTFYGRACIIN